MREIDFENDIKEASLILYQIADEIDRRVMVMSYILTIEHNYNSSELLDALREIEEQRELVYIMAGRIADLLEKYSGDIQE